ncbi:hypothetical protein [Caballeronia sp. LZ035]|uniref:hypothetical protein n=1 Tax=Caballeronia sp. LZ035 TaxID=3038568 RepID=UPI0028546927|nr:hypothetical protein [Caballeronia sp. LZ035]MDR5758811.1 hypothetical protein [Caballeronia sp. LZ035]
MLPLEDPHSNPHFETRPLFTALAALVFWFVNLARAANADGSAASSGASAAVSASSECANCTAVVIADWGLRIGVTVVVMLVALGFAVVALWCIGRTLGDPKALFGLRRHWGGFGGASTGWYLSPGLVRLLLGTVLAVLAGLLALTTIEAVFGLKKPDAGIPAATKTQPASGATAGKTDK